MDGLDRGFLFESVVQPWISSRTLAAVRLHQISSLGAIGAGCLVRLVAVAQRRGVVIPVDAGLGVPARQGSATSRFGRAA